MVWQTICSALGHWSLPPSPTHTDAINDITLLGLVAQAASFIRPRRAGGTVNNIQLAKLY